MKAFTSTLGLLLLLSASGGCSEGKPPNDVDSVIEANCTRNLSCGEFESFEQCAQGSYSILAAFEHVYGDLCLDAWLAILDCETQQECDAQSGCEPENSVLDDECGFAVDLPSLDDEQP